MLRWYVFFSAFFLNPLFSPLLHDNSPSPRLPTGLLRSSGVHRTKLLAKSFAEKAEEVLEELPESVAKAALVALTERVVARRS